MEQQRKKQLVAVVLLGLFLTLRAREFTGGRVHETMAFILFFGLMVHIFMHRKWIASTWNNRKSPNLPKRNRQSLLLAGLLAMNFLVSFVSGVMITRTFRTYMPTFIIEMRPTLVWVHVGSALLLIITLLLHLAINFKIIKTWFAPKKARQPS